MFSKITQIVLVLRSRHEPSDWKVGWDEFRLQTKTKTPTNGSFAPERTKERMEKIFDS